jgi:hypothetical protein
MQYADLIEQLQKLEQHWRGGSPPTPSPTRYPSHSLIRPTDNIQYFACSEVTTGKDLPVVVTVGINYTQGKRTIPGIMVADKVPREFEELCIESFNANSATWKLCCLASATMNSPILQKPGASISDFHLVMTNLSPWITNDSWASDIDPAPAADLLVSPPYCLGTASLPPNPFGHLDDFYKKLGDQVTLWIGHGLEVVSSHFRLFVQKHQIDNWLLTANTASGCKPLIQSGSTIKFKR